jgi:sugar lactone lactonase YvrE
MKSQRSLQPSTAGLIALMAVVSAAVALRGRAAPDNSVYRKVPNWPQLPEGMKLGPVPNMIPDAQGNVWMLQRLDPPIIKVDRSGKVIKSFGEGMFAHSHGMCMDRDGNLWAGDSGPSFPPQAGSESSGQRRENGRGYVFYKFNQDGKLLMTLGKAGVSKVGPDTFVAPTACIEAPNGDIIIADGHIPRAFNETEGDRLMRFSREGKFVRAYGRTGKGLGEFRGPHALAYDSQGRLFVADRQNSRLQVFDRPMKPVAEWRQFGRPSGLFILPDNTLLTLDSESGRSLTWADWPGDDIKATRNPGFTIGVRIGSAGTGAVALHFDAETQASSEMVAADTEGFVYTDGIKWEKIK